MDEQYVNLQAGFTRFAEQYIAPRDLYAGEFPRDLWEKMFADGLFDLCSSKKFPGNYLALSMAAEAMVSAGGNMGLALSWFMHQVVTIYCIMGFGNSKQQEKYYQQLATGGQTSCFAVSEPKTGAHPKTMRATAVREGDTFVLNGEKTFLTNAPIADLFIVVAITGNQSGKNLFTAFLVPKDTPGLSVSAIELPFLKPSPHGSLTLENCAIQAESILGNEGGAYEDIVKPFRALEDALLMGPLVGSMDCLLREIVKKRKGGGDNAEMALRVGKAAAIINSGRVMAYEAARMLDRDMRGPLFFSLLIVFRSLVSQIQVIFEEILPFEDDGSKLANLRNDFKHAITVAEKVALINQRRLGEDLLGLS